jgi:Holliday junction resolvasome RuvABC endonuclease subunit
MNRLRRYELVLAIYPNTSGFAFVLFEGSLSPVDWGVTTIRGRDRNGRCLQIIASMFARHEPDVLVLQDTLVGGTRRSKRVTNLNAAIFKLAELNNIPVRTYSRASVRLAFSYLGSASKHAIAETIAKHIPAFERYLPPPRKPWMTEDTRMGLFDAAALMLTFFQSGPEGKGHPPE